METGDQRLRFPIQRDKREEQPAAKVIARSPGLPAGVLHVQGHGLRLPGDQRVKCFNRDERATTHARSAKAASRDIIKNGRPAEAGRVAGFADAISDLRCCGRIRLHRVVSG